ncbi:MAG: universal stress protein [Desulfobacterales bacterium]|nr:universal stress protein [Desulfobacterales bacterium]
MTGQLDTVICATDQPAAGNRLLAYGKAFSKCLCARLVLCHVIDNVPPPLLTTAHAAAYAGLQRRRAAEANERLDQMLSGSGAEMPHVAEVVQGAVADQLRRLAGRSGVSMVITALRHLSWLERLTRESVTGALLATSSLSLLALTDGPSAVPQETLLDPVIARIVVGVDFLPGSGGALAMAVMLARRFNAELHLIRVLDSAGNGDPVRQIQERFLAPEAADGLVVKTVVTAGRPHEALVRYAAECRADLVVVGKRRRSRMLPLGIHSTAWRIMGRAVCPVLSVSPVFGQPGRFVGPAEASPFIGEVRLPDA